MLFSVYILFSKTKDNYYVGFTSIEIKERIKKHNTMHKGFTGGFCDWELKYIESFSAKGDAMQREKHIKKKKSRKYIESLITSKCTPT